MPTITVTIAETIDVPEGTQIVLASNGNPSGLRLPDGRFIKPWTTYEQYSAGNENNDPDGDAQTEDLMDMGIEVGLDYLREFTVIDGEIETDDSAINIA